MLELIAGYLCMNELLKLMFMELAVNKDVVNILLFAVIVISIILMFTKQKIVGTVVLIVGIAVYAIIYELVPYASTITLWMSVVTAVALFVVAKVKTYKALRHNTKFKTWQKVLIYLI